MESGSRIRNQKDFAAGLFYILIGGAFAIGALNYRIGEAARMGPGWFPFAVGALLVVVGVFTLLNGLRRSVAVEKVEGISPVTIAWILGSIIMFGLILKPAGLVISLILLIVASSKASHEFTWKSALTNAVALTVFCIGVFIYGIDLLIPLWPSFIE